MAEFQKVYREVATRTLLTLDRVRSMWDLVKKTNSVEGDLAEFGTYMGGNAKLMYKAANGTKKMHIFDTFSGIPIEQREEGDHLAGEFSASFEDVSSYLADCTNVTYYKGLVPDTLAGVENTYSFVHLDMDLYLPTIAALKYVWARMPKEGVIVLDDLDNLSCIGRAVEDFKEWLGNRGLYQYIKTVQWQAHFIKLVGDV